MLRLVPPGRYGRWQCAGLIFFALVAVYWLAGAFDTSPGSGEPAWPAALFFCAILAYITPIFHYITRRTEEALTALSDALDLSSEHIAALAAGISRKSAPWIAANLAIGASMWLLQSWLLTGSFAVMAEALTTNVRDFVMSVGPLPVWLFMTCAIHALVDNARLFGRLARSARIDLLDITSLHPFGRMAVSSTLVVIGAQALFPIMWLDAETDPWTTIPGLLGTTLPLVFLFIAPVWPIHRAIRAGKLAELARIQERVRPHSEAVGGPEYDALAPLLTYRREIHGVPEWPFDLSIVARLGLYLVIVPLTWIGAALIENVVDVLID